MKDIYLYDNSDTLINKLGIKDANELENAEANYTSLRLSELIETPLEGDFSYEHLLEYHKYIFQDIYDFAGIQRKLNIYKEEDVLGGLSIEYSDVFDIKKDATSIIDKFNKIEIKDSDVIRKITEYIALLWKVHPFREGNTRTIITFSTALIESKGFKVKKEMFEKHAKYVRTALVAYNAIFDDGDFSKKKYLENFIKDTID